MTEFEKLWSEVEPFIRSKDETLVSLGSEILNRKMSEISCEDIFNSDPVGLVSQQIFDIDNRIRHSLHLSGILVERGYKDFKISVISSSYMEISFKGKYRDLSDIKLLPVITYSGDITVTVCRGSMFHSLYMTDEILRNYTDKQLREIIQYI